MTITQRPKSPLPVEYQPKGLSPKARTTIAIAALALCLIVGAGIVWWLLIGSSPKRRTVAVDPAKQRLGLGQACMARVPAIARAWPADAVRLDAYDAPAGAGGFYARCGYRERGRVSYRGVPLIYFEHVLAT